MIAKTIYLTIGWITLLLGLIGIFVPLLPTTPFLLVSAWSFSRSSERLHQWLLNHPRFGIHIRNWESGHLMQRQAKVKSIIAIFITFSLSISFAPMPDHARIILAVFGVGLSIFLISLPEPEDKKNDD